MKLKVTPEILDNSPELQQLAMSAIMKGCSPAFNEGTVSYSFSPEGEILLKKAHIDLCYSLGVELDGLTVYVVQPASVLDNLVPVGLPNPRYIDNNGEEQRRIWEEYAPFHWVDKTGETVMFRCAHVPYGETSGNGLRADEFRLWYDQFNGSILTKAEGMQWISDNYEDPGA